MKILKALILLCLPMAAMGETYVCTSNGSDDLYTFKRDGLQFAREGYGTTYFEINGENDRWLFLSNAQLGQDDYFGLYHLPNREKSFQTRKEGSGSDEHRI